jgi:putative PIN family toxin of toxin-antitoxin system
VRIVLDSTILARANQRAAGPARALLLALLDHGHRLILAASVLDEVDRVLHYPPEITQFVAFLAASGQIVEVDEALTAPIRDPKDVHILQTAIGGKADYLCTLDGHFWETPVVTFCSNRGITVISDLDLLRLVRETPGETSMA